MYLGLVNSLSILSFSAKEPIQGTFSPIKIYEKIIQYILVKCLWTHQVGKICRLLDQYLHQVARRDLSFMSLFGGWINSPQLLLNRVQGRFSKGVHVKRVFCRVLFRRLPLLYKSFIRKKRYFQTCERFVTTSLRFSSSHSTSGSYIKASNTLINESLLSRRSCIVTSHAMR